MRDDERPANRHEVTVGRLASHVFVVLGLALLFVVRHQHRDEDRPGSGDALVPAEHVESGAEAGEHAGESARPHPRWHRPASRRRAA